MDDGQKAIDSANTNEFDLILMDCQMPTINGYQAASAIRENEPKNAHVPIVAITAGLMQDERDHCLQAGMDDFLPKPFRISDLSSILTAWLKDRKVLKIGD